MVTSVSRTKAGFDTLHPQLLLGFEQLVESLGGAPGELLREAGIVRCKGDSARHLSYTSLAHLLELSAQRLEQRDFGMRLARTQSIHHSFGLFAELMRAASTFAEGMDYLVEHNYLHSLAARIWKEYPDKTNLVFIGHDVLVKGVPNKQQLMEFILLLGHLGAQEFTAGYARARRVSFRHQAVSDKNRYRRYFACGVYFGQEADGLYFSRKDMACEVVKPDPAEFSKVAAYLQSKVPERSPPLHVQIRGAIMHLLSTGQSDLTTVAGRLKMHPRTLHRRLLREGTSFQQIKDEVRCDTMLYYLQHSRLSLAAISEKLDFAEQAIMSRRCRDWLGQPPSEVRARKSTTR